RTSPSVSPVGASMSKVMVRAVERIEVTFVERTEGTVPSPCTTTECPLAFSQDDDEFVNVAPPCGRSAGSTYAAATASVWPLPEATKSAMSVHPAGGVSDGPATDDEAAEAPATRRPGPAACVSSRSTAGVVWLVAGLASMLPT